MIAMLRHKGRVTIPAEIRRRAHLEEGDRVEFEVVDEGILLRPRKVDPAQAWFWTEEWQAKEREADAGIAAGRVTRHLSNEEFLTALRRAAADADARRR